MDMAFPSVPATWRFAAAVPAVVTAAVRRAIAEQEPGATVVSIEALPRGCWPRRWRVPGSRAMLAACFASVALLLSIVGTYGVLSFLVRQR